MSTTQEEFSFEQKQEQVMTDNSPRFEGVCSKCLGTKFLLTERDGVLGVLYTSNYQDNEGKPIKRLMSCDCYIKTSF